MSNDPKGATSQFTGILKSCLSKKKAERRNGWSSRELRRREGRLLSLSFLPFVPKLIATPSRLLCHQTKVGKETLTHLCLRSYHPKHDSQLDLRVEGDPSDDPSNGTLSSSQRSHDTPVNEPAFNLRLIVRGDGLVGRIGRVGEGSDIAAGEQRGRTVSCGGRGRGEEGKAEVERDNEPD